MTSPRPQSDYCDGYFTAWPEMHHPDDNGWGVCWVCVDCGRAINKLGHPPTERHLTASALDRLSRPVIDDSVEYEPLSEETKNYAKRMNAGGYPPYKERAKR